MNGTSAENLREESRGRGLWLSKISCLYPSITIAEQEQDIFASSCYLNSKAWPVVPVVPGCKEDRLPNDFLLSFRRGHSEWHFSVPRVKGGDHVNGVSRIWSTAEVTTPDSEKKVLGKQLAERTMRLNFFQGAVSHEGETTVSHLCTWVA